MSGPKIVDIRLLAAIQERQRRLIRERLKQLQKQWGEQRQRLESALSSVRSLTDGEEIAAIEVSITQMDKRFAQLRDDQSLQELENRGEEQLALLDAELQRLQQQINDSLIQSRLRARSIQSATNDLAARLRSAGMEEESRLLLLAPSSDALERAAKVLNRRDQDLVSQAMKEALSDLGVNVSSRQLQPEALDPERARIEQLMVRLELLDDNSTTADLRVRLDALDGEHDPRQLRLRLDSLALELSDALQRLNEAAASLAVLDELEAQLSVYETAPGGLLQAISDQRERPQQGLSLTDLRQAVESWCLQEGRRLDGERVRNVVLCSLRELGYDVREGMQTGWVEGGSIVLQKAGSRDYGVELQDLNGRFRSQVVRFGNPDSPVTDQQRQRDTEVEGQWCNAHAKTLENLRQQGMEAQVMAMREPGEVPLVVIRPADTALGDREYSQGSQSSAKQLGL